VNKETELEVGRNRNNKYHVQIEKGTRSGHPEIESEAPGALACLYQQINQPAAAVIGLKTASGGKVTLLATGLVVGKVVMGY
jgi:hypothetical protein